MSIKSNNSKLDARRLRELHEKYRECLLNGMIGVLRNRDAAKDVTAAAFAAAFKNLAQFGLQLAGRLSGVTPSTTDLPTWVGLILVLVVAKIDLPIPAWTGGCPRVFSKTNKRRRFVYP